MKKSEKNRLPKQVVSLRRNWRFLHRFWWLVHYVSGLCAILCAITSGSEYLIQVPYFKYTISPMLTGIAAAGFASVLIFLVPLRKSERYFAAFHLIDQAVLEILNNAISTATLLEKTAAGRDIVLGGVEAQTTRTDKKKKFPTEDDFSYEVPPSPQ